MGGKVLPEKSMIKGEVPFLGMSIIYREMYFWGIWRRQGEVDI